MREKSRSPRKSSRGRVRLLAEAPLALGVRKELNKPRYTPFTGILAAESKEIKTLNCAELDIDRSLIGLEGSPTKMAGLELKRFQRAREKVGGSDDEIVQKLLDKLYQYGIL